VNFPLRFNQIFTFLHYTSIMIDTRTLKIAIVCTEIGQLTLSSELDGSDITFTFFSDCRQMLDSFDQGSFDLVLVDSLHPDAGLICRTVYLSLRTPIALWVQANDSNWSVFGQWHVDGFIDQEAGKTELLVRLRAIARLCIRLPLTASVIPS
jgi:hypothetical protein